MVGKLRFAGDANTAQQADFLDQVCELLRLADPSQLKLAGIRDDASGGHDIDYIATQSVQLNGSEYGIADGVIVEEESTATLSFDPNGKLVSFHFQRLDEHYVQLVRNQVKRLAAEDEIAAEHSMPAGKPWYIETDARGIKRLKRAHMA